MYKNLLALTAFALAAASGCSPDRKDPENSNKGTESPTSPASLSYKTLEKTFKEGDCQNTEGKCFEFKLVYPVFSGDLAPQINQKLEGQLKEVMLSYMFTEGSPLEGTLDEAATAMTKSMGSELDEMAGEMPAAWSLDISCAVLYISGKHLSCQFDAYSYMGGAHPNTHTKLMTVSLPAFTRLALTDLVADIPALEALANKRFREVREIPQGQRLQDAGFFIEDDTLRLNDNFALTKEGLLFEYNAYEIGPYVLGSTEVLLRNNELEGLLKNGPY